MQLQETIYELIFEEKKFQYKTVAESRGASKTEWTDK